MDYNKASFLLKAQGIPIYDNEHTKLISKEELNRRAIKALDFLIKKGLDVNKRHKNDQTVLLAACHWGQIEIV